MRRGRHPKDAGMEALGRIKANTIEKRLLNSRGQPNFNVIYYVLNAKGEHAGVTLYEMGGKEPVRYAVCTEDGPTTKAAEGLFSGNPED